MLCLQFSDFMFLPVHPKHHSQSLQNYPLKSLNFSLCLKSQSFSSGHLHLSPFIASIPGRLTTFSTEKAGYHLDLAPRLGLIFLTPLACHLESFCLPSPSFLVLFHHPHHSSCRPHLPLRLDSPKMLSVSLPLHSHIFSEAHKAESPDVKFFLHSRSLRSIWVSCRHLKLLPYI